MAAFLLVALALHAWVGWRIAPALAPWHPADGLFQLFLLASAISMPLALRARRLRPGPLHAVLTWAGLLCMGLFSSLFVLTLLRDALLVGALGLAVVAGLVGSGSDWLRALVLYSGQAVPLLALAAAAWGMRSALRTAEVVRIDVPIAGLPQALHGFTVAQISDLHVGPTIRHAYVRRVVERVNGLQADLVAITGDLVDGRVADLGPHVAPLAELRSRHGSYFVTGNHEYYSGAAAWIEELQRLGISVLVNEHRVLRHGPAGMAAGDPDHALLVVAGVADVSAHHYIEAHRSDAVAALTGAPAEAGMRLLLAHQPRSAPAASRAGFQLQLSGHTHGGQIWPWMYLVPFQQPFTAGLDRLDDLWIYTHRGTGYWGPPKRLGAPSEIAFLRLVRA